MIAGMENAPALVLLHGFTNSGASWQPVISGLGERYRAIAPDIRGHASAGAAEPVTLERGDRRRGGADARAVHAGGVLAGRADRPARRARAASPGDASGADRRKPRPRRRRRARAAPPRRRAPCRADRVPDDRRVRAAVGADADPGRCPARHRRGRRTRIACRAPRKAWRLRFAAWAPVRCRRCGSACRSCGCR